MTTIENQDPNQVAFSVKGAPGQLPALVDIMNEHGVSKFAITKDGDVTAHAIQALNYTTAYSSLQAALDSSLNFGNNDEDNFKGRWGGRTLFHPAGTLAVTGTAFMSSNNSLVGEGKKSSVLSWQDNNTTTDGFTLMPSYVDNDFGMVGWWMIRDICFRGNGPLIKDTPGGWDTVALKTGITLRDDPYITPLRPEMKTYFDLTIADSLVYGWGGSCINIDTASEGWGGFNHLVRSWLVACGHYGLLLRGDQRPWTIQGCHVTNYGYLNNAASGIAMFSQFPLSMTNTAVETAHSAFGSGVSLAGVKHFNIDNLYLEGLAYGLDISGNASMGRVTNVFNYGGAYGLMLSDAVNVVVDGFSLTWAGKAGLFSGSLAGSVVKNWGANADCPIEWGTVTVEPERIENCTCPSSPYPFVVRGTGSHTGVPVKATAGAPTDAVYGAVVGTLVFNSDESKFYIKASVATDDWHSVTVS